MKHTKGFCVAAATAACVASLGFAACGGDDDASTDSSSSSSSTTEETGATGASGSDATAIFEQTFKDTLENSGLSPAVADCIIDHVNFDSDEAEQVASSGEIPDDIMNQVEQLGADCQTAAG
jgi:hypothetical protein